jgi:hypothetical protein
MVNDPLPAGGCLRLTWSSPAPDESAQGAVTPGLAAGDSNLNQMPEAAILRKFASHLT